MGVRGREKTDPVAISANNSALAQKGAGLGGGEVITRVPRADRQASLHGFYFYFLLFFSSLAPVVLCMPFAFQ